MRQFSSHKEWPMSPTLIPNTNIQQQMWNHSSLWKSSPAQYQEPSTQQTLSRAVLTSARGCSHFMPLFQLPPLNKLHTSFRGRPFRYTRVVINLNQKPTILPGLIKNFIRGFFFFLSFSLQICYCLCYSVGLLSTS